MNEVKTFKNQAAQGDVFFRKVTKLPEGCVLQEGNLIVTHSETGHHHSFDPTPNVFIYSTKDTLTAYLKVTKPAVLKHRRDFDTHAPILFKAGIYEISRQEEWTPAGWRVVQD